MSDKIFIPDFRKPDDFDVAPEDTVRYDIPHQADLVRKFVSSNPKIQQILQYGLGERTYEHHEQEGLPSGPTPKFITHNDSQIWSNHPTHYKDVLGHDTPADAEIYQLEDRVMDKKTGKPVHFDELPEVKELQYRMSALPVINHILDNSTTPAEDHDKFKKYKSSLRVPEEHSYVEPGINERGWQGFPHHAEEAFTIKEKTPFEFEADKAAIDDRPERTLDYFKHVHNNITNMYLTHKDENIQEHLGGLIKAYNQLWDKLDSGEYERHPNFWSGYAFSSQNNRDTAWKQIISQAPELSSKGKNTGLSKEEFENQQNIGE